MTRLFEATRHPGDPAGKLWTRDYGLYWLSRSVSVLGSQMTYVVFPLLAITTYRAALPASLVSVCTYAGGLLFGLHAGVLGDRIHRKRLMITADLVRLVLLAGFSAVVAEGAPPLALTCVVALLGGAFSAIFNAASTAALPDIVGEATLPRAISRNQSRDFAIAMIGPPIGATLFSVSHALPFVIDAATYAVSALLLAGIAAPLALARDVGDREPTRTMIAVGLRFVWHNRVLRWVLLFLTVLSLVLTGSTFTVVAWFGAVGPQRAVGFVPAAQAVGGFVGALFAGWIFRRLSGTAIAVLQGFLWAFSLVIVATIREAWIAVAAMGIAWLAVPALRLTFQTHLAADTPREMRGRVNGVQLLAATAVSPVGPLVCGALADSVGFPGALLSMAAVAVGATVATIILPHLRAPLDWHVTAAPVRAS